MSVATHQNLAGSRLSHSQNVFECDEMVQLGLFFRREPNLCLTLDQFRDAMLRFGRRTKVRHRFRSCPRGDEIDNLEIRGTGRDCILQQSKLANSRSDRASSLWPAKNGSVGPPAAQPRQPERCRRRLGRRKCDTV